MLISQCCLVVFHCFATQPLDCICNSLFLLFFNSPMECTTLLFHKTEREDQHPVIVQQTKKSRPICPCPLSRSTVFPQHSLTQK